MAKRLMPDHIAGTARQWRVRKRREFRAIIDAFNKFRLGCAFTPVDYDHLDKTLNLEWDALKGNWKP